MYFSNITTINTNATYYNEVTIHVEIIVITANTIAPIYRNFSFYKVLCRETVSTF